MIRRIAQYQLRPGEEAVVLQAIEDFVAAVHTHEPNTTYEAYRLNSGLAFVHFMAFPDAAAEDRHRHAWYTERFVAALYPRCEIQPVFTELAAVGPTAGPLSSS